jgi:hypothetical protein
MNIDPKKRLVGIALLEVRSLLRKHQQCGLRAQDLPLPRRTKHGSCYRWVLLAAGRAMVEQEVAEPGAVPGSRRSSVPRTPEGKRQGG